MIKYFFDFVEIRTKAISVFSYVVAVLFYISFLYKDYGVDVLNFILFFISMLFIDMFVTALNHVSAYYKEDVKGAYDKELISSMNENRYSVKTNIMIILFLTVIYTVIGIVLVYRSNIGVLLLGMLSVLIGILYSFGKRPISYTPFGEIFAGGAMGVLLPVIVIFTQFDHLPFELNPLIAIVFLPLAFLIGNVLFANNICDIEIDTANKRYTLAYYTKEKLGIILMQISNLGVVCTVAISSLLGYVPYYFNIIFIILIPLFINTREFGKKCDKKTSFPLILKNFVIFCLTYSILFVVSIVIN